jgi:hypothetical protein
MILELHDNETGNTLVARIKNLDYDYQAELWVQDTVNEPQVVKWVLLDDIGVRCVWERNVGETGKMPDITRRSSRFMGEWQEGPAEVVIPEPSLSRN